jgi:CheY-like chemotaxis protein
LGKKQFDAIISDIALPDGTGYALISQAQRRGIHALCIAVSAYPYPSDVEEPGVTGFQYHLVKPINCDHLCSLLTLKAVPTDGDTSTSI